MVIGILSKKHKNYKKSTGNLWIGGGKIPVSLTRTTGGG